MVLRLIVDSTWKNGPSRQGIIVGRKIGLCENEGNQVDKQDEEQEWKRENTDDAKGQEDEEQHEVQRDGPLRWKRPVHFNSGFSRPPRSTLPLNALGYNVRYTKDLRWY